MRSFTPLGLLVFLLLFGRVGLALAQTPEPPPAPLPTLSAPGPTWRALEPETPLEIARFQDAARDITLALTVVDALGGSPRAVVDDWEAQLHLDPRVTTVERSPRLARGLSGAHATLKFQGRVAFYWLAVIDDPTLDAPRLACLVWVEAPIAASAEAREAFDRALESIALPR